MKKERDTRVLKIIAVFLLIVIVFPTFGNIFGAINEYYKGSEVTFTGRSFFGSAMEDILSKPIFWFIDTVASIAESLLTKFAELIAKETSR